jgi:HAD superfamily hydrolase (TIGR01509 family)
LARYEAILFDFDGVLVDSEPVHLACWMEVLAPFGSHMDWPTCCERYIGVDDRLMIEGLCREVDPPVPFEQAWARYPDKKQLFEDRMHQPGVIAPEMAEMLAELRRTYRIAVVTSSGRSEVEPMLRAAGLLDLVDATVFGGEAARPKPAPDPYLLAARRLNVRSALVVEDSPAGLASGRAAGFDVLAVPSQKDVRRLLYAALEEKDRKPDQARSEEQLLRD